ncbi:hypothetical protein FSP39_009295 [Pinctada imbricata]|uniref:guanylate cyclase n=1 Tax=Pinctada imbricata TaxID=66713 RepID=A0AA88XF42_PINIB|nr:hypothetical protein FSP39_009295 [Pinctada imbricata]
MISVLGSTFEVFVQNLDHLHSILATTYKGMRPPSFRFETSGERLLIHIMTQRKGTYPIAIGKPSVRLCLLKESAQQLFKTEIFLTVVDTNGPITDERYIDHVIAEVKVLSKHKSRRVTQGSRTDSGRQGSRKKFRIGREQFQHLMPYGISFDSKLQIRTAGINIMTLCPHILDKSLKMNDVFQLVEPKIDFSYDKMIKSKINSFYLKFVLSGRDDDGYQDEKERAIVLKGPLLHIEEDRELIFLGSPHFDSLADFSASSTLLSVIPTEALSIEILFMYNQRKADMEMSKKLDITTAKLQKLAISLEEEKKKTDSLLYQMLPYKVANQLRDGKPVEAENHEAVTILFSDIVSFTMMASKTEPMGTVNVLNQLFHKFDTLSIRHGVYKVETIGDAYMVVSGVPEVDEEHAQKLSNMAVDMMEESRTVLNPYTKCPLQIRIGLHSGPVVTGVVGIKMPRFCLFGDTVNTASRMESSGLPGKIHISDATYE